MNTNRPHWLPTNDGSRVPTAMVFLDTESHRSKLQGGKLERLTFRLGCATAIRRERGEWTRRIEFNFDDPKLFWEWIRERMDYYRTLWLFAHNLGHDLTQLGFWDELDSGRFSFKDIRNRPVALAAARGEAEKDWNGCLVAADPPTICVVSAVEGFLKSVDTLNYWRCGVEELGHSLCLPKLDMPAPAAPAQEWFDYCRRDTTIIEHAVRRLVDEWDTLKAGVWDTTAAGLASHAWRHCTPKKTLWIDHGEPHTSLARQAYYGGQCEAYFIGKLGNTGGKRPKMRNDTNLGPNSRPQGPFYYLDVRSFYPWIMLGCQFPLRIRSVIDDPPEKQVVALSRSFGLIGRVLIDTDEPLYPVRDGTTVYWPIGRFVTELAGPELGAALDRGHVVRCRQLSTYHLGRPFERFVDRFWGMRKQALLSGNVAQAELCKLLMDSLSGKFAQHRLRWCDVPGVPSAVRWGEWLSWSETDQEETIYRGVAGHTQEFLKAGEGKHAHVALSAFITSWGRVHMEHLRRLCPAGSVLYQDTDSLLVTQAGRDALPVAASGAEPELGELRQVWQADSVTIFGPKAYRHDSTVVAAGLPSERSAKRGNAFAAERWPRLNGQLRNKPEAVALVEQITFRLTGGEGKRTKTRSGWTQPCRLNAGDPVPF